jgi:hypothetical protein
MTGTAFITSATVAKWDAAKRVNFAEHVAAKARRLMLPKNSCSFLGQGSVVHTRHAHWTSRCVMRATVFVNSLRSPDNLSDVILFYVHPFFSAQVRTIPNRHSLCQMRGDNRANLPRRHKPHAYAC